MAVVGETESSMYNIPSHHHNNMQNLMDWSADHGGHPTVRGLIHDGLSDSYLGHADNFPTQGLNLQHSQFDLSEVYRTPKVDPCSAPLCNQGDFDYLSPASQLSSSQGSYHISGGSPFISQLQQHAYSSQSSIQHQGGGVLEEINGMLRSNNFVDVSDLHQQSLDMESFLFDVDDSVSHYNNTVHPYSGSFTTLPGVGGPILQPQQNPVQWKDHSQFLFPVELHESLNLSASSLETNQSLNSENSPGMFSCADDNFFPEMGRGFTSVQSNWSTPGNLKSSSPLVKQQQFVLKHQQGQRLNGLAPVGGYPPSDSGYFLRPSHEFDPSSLSPLPHPVQNARMLSNFQASSLSDEVLLGTNVPATGVQLVHLLVACAEAVEENRMKEAEVILARLRNHVLPGGSPMQRLAAYFEEALRERLTKDPSSAGMGAQPCNLPQAELLEAYSVYYDCMPIGKFGHLTCNQILLDAVEREKVVHVLDLHIWHGMQWPAFLQALALRPGGPPKVRMSAVGSDVTDLAETGEKLNDWAKKMSVPFEFCPILTTLELFSADMVEVRRGETFVVNSFVQFHGILNKGSNRLAVLLGDLRRLNPRVMAFAENDGSHNNSSFLKRFVECLRYYSAVFDAFEKSLPPDSPARMKMEKIFAAQKIMNIIACEGPSRVDGHETMKYWHKRMEAAHFRCLPLSSRAVSQANLLLNLYYSNGYTLNSSDCGYLALGWHGMPLMGVSAWHSVNS